MMNNIVRASAREFYRSTRFQLINQVRCCVDVSKQVSGYDDFTSKYSKRQQSLILKTINKGKEEELIKFGMSEDYVQIITSYLQKNGLFTTLNDIPVIDKYTLSQLENLCSAITQKHEPKSKTLLSPTMTNKKKQNLNTFVGIRIRKNYISWLHLDRNGCILGWQCENFTDLPLNADILEMIRMARKLQSTIPNADAYVMEKNSAKPNASVSGALHRVFSRQEQIISLIISLLLIRGKDLNEISDHNLVEDFYLMRSQAPANLFKLCIGGEIVNSHSIVSSILETKTVQLKQLTNISIDDDIIKTFKTAGVLKQDELGQVLLLSLTFFNGVFL